jgi:ATP-dependent DNA helicase RecG
MIFAEILTSPEGKTLEFKRDTSALKEIMRTIVAFANTAAGRL